MKKLVKVLSFVLVVLLCVGTVDRHVEAKSIYFDGKYKNGNKILRLNQYSSPDGSIVGNCLLKKKGKKKVYQESIWKIGKNKYATDMLFPGHAHYSEVTFKVYKNKVTVDGTDGFDGTYKLIKRYYH